MPQPAFESLHLPGIGFMVVAHQMQNTVKDQNAHLVIK